MDSNEMFSPEGILELADAAVRAERRRARDSATASEDYTATKEQSPSMDEKASAAMDFVMTLKRADQRFTQTMGRATVNLIEQVTGLSTDEIFERAGEQDGQALLGLEIGPDGFRAMRVTEDGVEPLTGADPDRTPSGKSSIEGIDMSSFAPSPEVIEGEASDKKADAEPEA